MSNETKMGLEKKKAIKPFSFCTDIEDYIQLMNNTDINTTVLLEN